MSHHTGKSEENSIKSNEYQLVGERTSANLCWWETRNSAQEVAMMASNTFLMLSRQLQSRIDPSHVSTLHFPDALKSRINRCCRLFEPKTAAQIVEFCFTAPALCQLVFLVRNRIYVRNHNSIQQYYGDRDLVSIGSNITIVFPELFIESLPVPLASARLLIHSTVSMQHLSQAQSRLTPSALSKKVNCVLVTAD